MLGSFQTADIRAFLRKTGDAIDALGRTRQRYERKRNVPDAERVRCHWSNWVPLFRIGRWPLSSRN
jgi:hypothetical protein